MRNHPETQQTIGMATPAPSPTGPRPLIRVNATDNIPELRLPRAAIRFAPKHTEISQPQRADGPSTSRRQQPRQRTTTTRARAISPPPSPPVIRAFTDEERALHQAQMELREQMEQREWEERNVGPEEQRMRDAMGPSGRFEIVDMGREMRKRMEAMDQRITELRRRGDRAHKRVQKELAIMASRTKDLTKAVEKLSLDKSQKEEEKENMEVDKE